MVSPPRVARHDVIEIQVVPLKDLAAVLAGVLIALQKTIVPRISLPFSEPIEEEAARSHAHRIFHEIVVTIS